MKSHDVAHVVVVHIIHDGRVVGSGTYPNATKRQGLTYAEASAEARALDKQGFSYTLKATVYGPTDDTEMRAVFQPSTASP